MGPTGSVGFHPPRRRFRPFRFLLPLLLLTGCAYSADVRHSGSDQEVEDYTNMCLLKMVTAPPADQEAILNNCIYYINYYNWKKNENK